MIFLIRYWKYIALVLAVLSVLSALWYYGHTKYRQGYEAAMSEVATAKAEADEQTRKKQSEIRKSSQKVENEILQDKTGDRPISPILRRQLERMSDR